MTDDFDVVSDAEAQRIKQASKRGQDVSAWVEALTEGKTLHFRAGTKNRNAISSNATLVKRGFRARTQTDGAGGFYAWAEKREED